MYWYLFSFLKQAINSVFCDQTIIIRLQISKYCIEEKKGTNMHAHSKYDKNLFILEDLFPPKILYSILIYFIFFHEKHQWTKVKIQ